MSTVVRTAIDSAGPLEERARRLLLQRWPRSPVRPLQALSLEVSEFEQPVQLAFSEIDRIDQSGRLRGMDAIRRQTLLRQEEVLATRYGDPTFRHVTDVDPSSILTERRFRWSAGLFIEASPGGDRAVPTRRRR